MIEIEPIRSDLVESANALMQTTLAATEFVSKPRFIHMCGIPGAGKTTYTNYFLKRNPQFALVQFDSVMEALPGYFDSVATDGPEQAFAQFELPARVIGYHLLNSFVENSRHVFFDHGAMNRKHVDLLKSLCGRGYKVEMHYVECDINEAFGRISHRETEEGRHTPRDIVLERHALLQELLPIYKGLVHEFVTVEPSVYQSELPNICTAVANREECIGEE